MATKPGVINEALVFMGQPPVVGPADSSTWVKRLTERYPDTVKLLLEQHPWNFPAVIQKLERLAEVPAGRAYAYNKPAALLRINWINDTGDPRDTEFNDYTDLGGKVLSDCDTLYASYISSDWMTKEGSWPQVFARAVSAELAFVAMPTASKSDGKHNKAFQLSEKMLKKAKSWDASQQSFRPLPGGRWARARRGGRYNTEGR